MNKKSKVYILSILLLGLILIIGTYAWFTWRSSESRLVLTIGEIDDARVILKPYKIDKEIIPVLTYEGEEYTEVEAINKNNNTKMITLYYHINNIDNELISSDFKYTILRSTDNGNTYSEYITGNFNNAVNDSDLFIMKETIETNTNYKYQVYLWLDGSDSGQGNISGKSFNGELRAKITGNNIKVDVPNGLIPIIYDISNGTKVKTISSIDNNWYDYDNKEWANAVLVSDGSRSKYLDTSGVEVSEGDILAYYVYIPRYKYKIWEIGLSSTDKEQEIEIVFEDKNTSKSMGTKVGEYRTHSAFTFGDTELNGIWIGKFETGGTAEAPVIKPDIVSLTNQSISEQFATSKIFGTSNYGISNKVDAHMIKNREWGAIAYLSRSKYGVNREVYINNSSGIYTGRSGGNVGGSTAINTVYNNQTSTDRYNTYGFYTWDGYLLNYNTNTKSSIRDLSKVASTTGNINGVYDMSGGAFEYVMGVLADDNGNPRSETSASLNSGFNGTLSDGTKYTSGVSFPDTKYYDLYTSSDPLTACNGEICYGHAFSETYNWYGKYVNFVVPSYPWVDRGIGYTFDTLASELSFDYFYGSAFNTIATRSVLSVIN